jgi:lipopolysaccharide transport system permease protein
MKAFVSVWRQRELLWQLTKRDVVGRYKGSVMGLMWSLFNPLLMLTIYTFVFGVVFKSRWGSSSESTAEFALVLFAGMIVYTVFAECVNRAPSLIVGNVNYVKKVVFPLEILPWMALGSALFHAAISVCVLLVLLVTLHGQVSATALFVPVLLAPLALMTVGCSWFLASIGVYFRDVAQITGMITTGMLFLSPVFYPTTAVPDAYRALLYINPLTFAIEQVREVLIWGRMPDWGGWLGYAGLSVAVGWLASIWFEKTRKGFADVL